MNDITNIAAVVAAPMHAISLILLSWNILYVAMQINRYGNSVVTTEMLASPEAVATGAGDRARTALPTLPMSEIFKSAYTVITSAGMAHISKPVKVQ